MVKDKNTYKVLVVEDNPGDFALVEDFLFDHVEAPVVVQARDFKEAKENLQLNEFEFNIILLDLSLPDATGLQLIREMMSLCKGIPVVVLTGYSDFSFGVKSLAMGVADYLLKEDLTATALYKSIVYSIERKKNVVALEDSKKRYSELFDFSPLPMWVINTDTLEFLDVNIATINHYGYTREEFLSMTLKDIRPSEEIPYLLQAFEEDRQNPKEHSHRIMVHKRKSGELLQVDIQITSINFNGVKANIVIATDITERLKYVKAIEDQNEKFKEISWMQSHIIRAPLTRIMGLIPLINNLSENEDDRKMILSYLSISANELDEVIKNITNKTQLANYQVSEEYKKI